jgi:hypothetical protein
LELGQEHIIPPTSRLSWKLLCVDEYFFGNSRKFRGRIRVLGVIVSSIGRKSPSFGKKVLCVIALSYTVTP